MKKQSTQQSALKVHPSFYDLVSRTPLQKVNKLSLQLGQSINFKREDLQPIHSFKIRGAYNKIASLGDQQKKAGVIAASAGNHAQGVALSAKELDIPAVIVMPETTPSIKVEAVKSYGAKVVLSGDNYSEAYAKCQELMKASPMTFIHPFDDRMVIDGQATVAKELLEQHPDLDYIFVPVGGGGLIAGVAEYVKKKRPDIKVIGVEPADSNAMQQSLATNKRLQLDHVGIFADGVAVKQVGDLTYQLAKQYVDEIITVSVDQVCAAIKAIFEDSRAIVEPAGALSVAGATKYFSELKSEKNKQVACILSGANMTFERLQFIAERTLIGSGKEALFAIELPEKAGSLRKLCLDVINGFSISEFSYRYKASQSTKDKAVILIGINLNQAEDKNQLIANLTKHRYNYYDLTLDEIAKEHIRHMVGGPSKDKNQEMILEVNFPEKPGALLKFLDTISQKWSISLFHYRGLGADKGRVLIGFRGNDWSELKESLKATNYEYHKVDSESIELFL